MWNHYLIITIFCQNIYRLRVIYNQSTEKFESVHKSSKLYNWENTHVTQTSLVAFSRCLYYLNTDNSKSTMTFTDFIIDFLFWGLTLVMPTFVLSFWKWKDNYSWFLNQAYKHRKIKGNKQILS